MGDVRVSGDKQYGYRFYDNVGASGPLTREQVLAKLLDDLSAIPLERHRPPGGVWSGWTESSELLRMSESAEALLDQVHDVEDVVAMVTGGSSEA